MPAWAESDDDQRADIVITHQRQRDTAKGPATTASTDAETIARQVNAMNVEDTVKYLPSLIVRKRHIGDTQAPLATRTSGLGASARNLIYADGALLSALIGNNNTSASPRWSLVSPQEIERIDVLYGPFAAAYPGNSIGAVVNITTRLPDHLEGSVTAGTSVQTYDQYAGHATYPAYQFGATIGDRFGPLAIFASYDNVHSRSQPLTYVTALVPAATGSIGTPVTGAVPDLNRTGAAIRVFGESGIEDQRQQRAKLRLGLDLTPSMRLSYTGALFFNRTDASATSYLTGASGPVYAGSVNIEGRPYTIAASAFSGGVYTTDQRHWSHALSLAGDSRAVDWQVIATSYRFDRDTQRSPTTALPTALGGGAGTITRLDGTGWTTLDAKAAWRAGGGHVLSGGLHGDRFVLASNRYATSGWRSGSEGALTLQSLGRTGTAALWAQDAWTIAPPLTLTIGARQEWWRAYGGVNFSASPAIAAQQPERSAARLSPKATLAWSAAPGLTLRLSYGEAWRFPTVGELYQVVTTPVAAVPNPTLRPEHARSEELAIEHAGAKGTLRLSLFNEIVGDALVSQSGPLNGTATIATFVQNVDRTRARGVEAAIDRRDVIPRVDLAGSVTYADATTRADPALPAAIGKAIPGVPRWKATAVATWRPIDRVSLTAAARYARRIYGTLDNSDTIGNTYQGFYRYLVADLRAQFAVTRAYTLGLGVDNLTNDRYFLFHPFTQRTFHADATLRF
ncbi:MAG: TonB-dependent receptor [Sphingomonas sp.]|nr:TonB-dependent receptor [Sphingomonas sp.]